MRRARVLAVVALAAVPGCLSLGRAPVDVREYDLVAASVDSASDVAPLASGTTLEVEPFGVSEALDREGLAWRKGVETGVYSAHRWARPPHHAVREAVAAAVAGAVASATVATDPPLADPDLLLRAYLARCEETDRGDAWFAVLELRVTLVRRDGVELLRRTYLAEEPSRVRNPLGVVEALERGLGRIAHEVARDVRTVTTRTPDAGEPAR